MLFHIYGYCRFYTLYINFDGGRISLCIKHDIPSKLLVTGFEEGVGVYVKIKLSVEK